MAHHKAGGSTKNGRDSAGRRLGLKVCGGGSITAGAIIVRQRGTRYFPKDNVDMGKDHTIFALICNSNGWYYPPTKERSIGDFKGRSLARCTRLRSPPEQTPFHTD